MSSSVDKEKPTKYNPTIALTVFIVITVIYISYEYYVYDNDANDKSSKLNMAAYLILLLIVEFMINSSHTKSVCGSYQLSTALIATLVPWGVIYSAFILLLSIMPGWLSPFSNTFGYAIANMSGLDDTLNKLLKNPSNDAMKETISNIYSNKSLLINEVTPENFEIFWRDMKGLFKEDDVSGILKKRLRSLILLKYSVAKVIWYVLTGILITSISYNYIISSSCINSDSTKEINDYVDDLHATQSTETTKRDYKVA